jgi:exodeoxyribonuclease V alpha subunit
MTRAKHRQKSTPDREANPVSSGQRTVAGTVQDVVFSNPENHYSVLRVELDSGTLVTICGTAPSISAGERVDCHGRWIQHPTHGPQFEAKEIRIARPNTPAGVALYLASNVDGFGKAKALRLASAFGDRLVDVLENRPGELERIKGISPSLRAGLVEAWGRRPKEREMYIFLTENEVGPAHAQRIVSAYGPDGIDAIRANPYELAKDIDGIGFKKADKIARKLGITANSPHRLHAAIRYALEEFASSGHCAMGREELIAAAQKVLHSPDEPTDDVLIEQAIHESVADQSLVIENVDGVDCLFLPSIHRAECAVARETARLLSAPSEWPEIQIDKALGWVQQQTGMNLSTSQASALRLVLSHKLSIITGGPGVGKTAITRCLLRIVAAKKLRVVLCAPTGRAAKRLAEATGHGASTIHRLLDFDPRSRRFLHNRENPIDADLVIVDEHSMLDIHLTRSLLRAIPTKASVLFIGDPDQLPSVGPGSVLADMLATPAIPRAHLTEVFRQSEASRIVLAAHAINHGIYPDVGEGDFEILAHDEPAQLASLLVQTVTTDLPARHGFDPIRDIQVISPMHRGVLGTQALNKALQLALNQGRPGVEQAGFFYSIGDKVFQARNDYEKQIMNGDQGIIVDADPLRRSLTIDFDGKTLVYEHTDLKGLVPGYCSTVHKAQGSEYPCVVIPLVKEHYLLLDRKLLYTAVTRGRQRVVLVCQRSALRMTIQSISSSTRRTHLARRLISHFDNTSRTVG